MKVLLLPCWVPVMLRIVVSSLVVPHVDSLRWASSPKTTIRRNDSLRPTAATTELLAAALEVGATSEVVGAHGTVGSRFFLGEAGAIAVPRGVAPGCLTDSRRCRGIGHDDGVPIVVAVPPREWKTVYRSTLCHRRPDLVWVTDRNELQLLRKNSWQKEGTVVALQLLHRKGEEEEGDGSSESSFPTLVYGKHAAVMQSTLEKNPSFTGTVSEVESWPDLCDLAAEQQRASEIDDPTTRDKNDPESYDEVDDHPPKSRPTATSVPVPAIGLVCTGEPNGISPKSPGSRGGIRSAIVVGGGILGSSIARALTSPPRSSGPSDHWNVTIYDPTPAGLATPASWAWLNANQKPPHAYSSLNQMGLRGWRTDPLLSSLGSLKWSGTLVRTKEPLPVRGGYRREGPLTAERIRELEPQAEFSMAAVEEGYCYFFPDEGHVDPQEAVSALRREARDNGASFSKDGEHVVGLVRDDAGCVVGVQPSSSREPQLADVVIIAAGANSSLLGGVPLVRDNPSKTYFGDPSTSATEGPVHLDRTLVDMVSSIYLAQRPDGTVVAGGGAVKFGLSAGAVRDKPSAKRSREQLVMAQEVARSLAPRPVADSPLTHVRQVASKPMPLDGFPIVGFVESGLYVAVTHSGMTLSPLLGQLVAAEVKGRISLRILDDYRPTRFSKETGHDAIQDWQESESKETA